MKINCLLLNKEIILYVQKVDKMYIDINNYADKQQSLLLFV